MSNRQSPTKPSATIVNINYSECSRESIIYIKEGKLSKFEKLLLDNIHHQKWAYNLIGLIEGDKMPLKEFLELDENITTEDIVNFDFDSWDDYPISKPQELNSFTRLHKCKIYYGYIDG